MILPDVLAPQLDIVFCGTAAGDQSAIRQAYYAGPGNQFYPTLYTCGLTTCKLLPHEFRTLLSHRIGLTDLAKKVHGADDTLDSEDFDRDNFVGRSRCISRNSSVSMARRLHPYTLGSAIPKGYSMDCSSRPLVSRSCMSRRRLPEQPAAPGTCAYGTS